MVVCLSESRLDVDEIVTALLFVDGNCRFCTSVTYRFARKIETTRLRIGVLQSEAGQIAKNYADNSYGNNGDSMVLILVGECLVKSDALIRLCHLRGGAWRIFTVAWLVPRFIRDVFYDCFGAVRYQAFGRNSQCEVLDSVPVGDVTALLP